MWCKDAFVVFVFAIAREFGVQAACSFARSGLAVPADGVHARLSANGSIALPNPLPLSKNAFKSDGWLGPLPQLSGTDELLVDVLEKFADQRGDDLCYWSYQALPPPQGGPTLVHPERNYFDMQAGQHDEDVEWVQAYQEVAVARLHSLVHPGGPVVGSMCASGSEQAQRRCANGRARDYQCTDAIKESNMSWPMAIAIFKVGHPDLESTIFNWRNAGNMHVPNMYWTFLGGAKPLSTGPWPGPMPDPGETNPEGMPNPEGMNWTSSWPVSKTPGWGAGQPKVAKVVLCSDIPAKFMYSEENFHCDHMTENPALSTADEGFAIWRSLEGVWPPTKACADDVEGVIALLEQNVPTVLPVAGCSDALAKLQDTIDNFSCDYILFDGGHFRDVCCSVCGGEPIPDVPAPTPPSPVPPPPPSPSAETYRCTVCEHVYDVEADGAGQDFEDLLETWVCPVCGAPKSAYVKAVEGKTERSVFTV